MSAGNSLATESWTYDSSLGGQSFRTTTSIPTIGISVDIGDLKIAHLLDSHQDSQSIEVLPSRYCDDEADLTWQDLFALLQEATRVKSKDLRWESLYWNVIIFDNKGLLLGCVPESFEQDFAAERIEICALLENWAAMPGQTGSICHHHQRRAFQQHLQKPDVPPLNSLVKTAFFVPEVPWRYHAGLTVWVHFENNHDNYKITTPNRLMREIEVKWVSDPYGGINGLGQFVDEEELAPNQTSASST